MKVAALVLAAGQGRRFGAGNKLLTDLGGRPLLHRAVEAAVGSKAAETIVVTGHDRAEVEAALAGLPLSLAHNPDFSSGMAGSLRRGLATAADADAVVVLLGDMPGVTAGLVDLLIDAFEKAPDSVAVVPLRAGKRGNPALLARALFPALGTLQGDEGARRLLARAEHVLELPVDDGAILADVDAPADLDAFRGLTRK